MEWIEIDRTDRTDRIDRRDRIDTWKVNRLIGSQVRNQTGSDNDQIKIDIVDFVQDWIGFDIALDLLALIWIQIQYKYRFEILTQAWRLYSIAVECLVTDLDSLVITHMADWKIPEQFPSCHVQRISRLNILGDVSHPNDQVRLDSILITVDSISIKFVDTYRLIWDSLLRKKRGTS